MCSKRISPIDNVSNDDFIKIVQDMKPKIGFFGGRYFVSGKKSYTMNQITEKFSKNISPDLGKVIFEKDAQATALLKNANCFQKMLTKIKQKNGNRHFKSNHPEFVGKEAVLQAIADRSGLSTVNPQPQRTGDSPLQTVNPQPQRTGDSPLQTVNQQPQRTGDSPLQTVNQQPQNNGILDQRVQKLIEEKNFTVALWSIVYSDVPKDEQKRCYYELVEAYRKQGDFDNDFDQINQHCQRSLPSEYLPEIYRRLASNHCKEAKKESDYITAGKFVQAYGGKQDDCDEILLDVVEWHISENAPNAQVKIAKTLEQLYDKCHVRLKELMPKLKAMAW
jgi:hypothetical protein